MHQQIFDGKEGVVKFQLQTRRRRVNLLCNVLGLLSLVFLCALSDSQGQWKIRVAYLAALAIHSLMDTLTPTHRTWACPGRKRNPFWFGLPSVCYFSAEYLKEQLRNTLSPKRCWNPACLLRLSLHSYTPEFYIFYKTGLVKILWSVSKHW